MTIVKKGLYFAVLICVIVWFINGILFFSNTSLESQFIPLFNIKSIKNITDIVYLLEDNIIHYATIYPITTTEGTNLLDKSSVLEKERTFALIVDTASGEIIAKITLLGHIESFLDEDITAVLSLNGFYSDKGWYYVPEKWFYYGWADPDEREEKIEMIAEQLGKSSMVICSMNTCYVNTCFIFCGERTQTEILFQEESFTFDVGWEEIDEKNLARGYIYRFTVNEDGSLFVKKIQEDFLVAEVDWQAGGEITSSQLVVGEYIVWSDGGKVYWTSFD